MPLVAVSRAQAGAVLGLATLAPTVFAFAGPTIIDLRTKAADKENRRTLRQAEVLGAVTVVGLGCALGLVVDDGDWFPVVTSLFVAGAMVAVYEHAIRKPKVVAVLPTAGTIQVDEPAPPVKPTRIYMPTAS